MDIALGIEVLVPAAQYFGSTTDNTKGSFDNLIWNDERAKPSFKDVEAAFKANYTINEDGLIEANAL